MSYVFSKIKQPLSGVYFGTITVLGSVSYGSYQASYTKAIQDHFLDRTSTKEVLEPVTISQNPGLDNVELGLYFAQLIRIRGNLVVEAALKACEEEQVALVGAPLQTPIASPSFVTVTPSSSSSSSVAAAVPSSSSST